MALRLVCTARPDHASPRQRRAVRFLNWKLAFQQGSQEFHREKLAERARYEERTPGFQFVIDDIYAIGKGMLVGRPR